jgi:hypothetical protein
MEFFEVNPEEVFAQVRAQRDRQHQEHEYTQTRVTNFLEGLSGEDLWCVYRLLASSPDHWGGYLHRMLEDKGLCMEHGEVHPDRHEEDEKMEDLFRKAPLEAQVTDDVLPEEAEPEANPESIVGMTHAEYTANLKRWRVVEDPEPSNLKQVRCECGLNYMSLEDRMLRSPEDCEGCVHKTKWG